MSYQTDPDYLAALAAYNRGLPAFETALALGHNQYWNHFANLSNTLEAIQRGEQPASAARSDSVAFVNSFLAVPSTTPTMVVPTVPTVTPVVHPACTGDRCGIQFRAPTPIAYAPTAAGPFLGGLLEGQIFGIDKTVLLIGGVALWFLMSDGKKR